jgi:hypothetical protein
VGSMFLRETQYFRPLEFEQVRDTHFCTP